MIYQFNAGMLPDSDFHPGNLKYLVPGNKGRMLDARRTPIRILEIKRASGFFVLEVLDFEDKGVQWEIPIEDVEKFQLARSSAEASQADIQSYIEIIERLDQPLNIPVDPGNRAASEVRISTIRVRVKLWLEDKSGFLASGVALDFSTRTGNPALWRDLENYMKSVGLWDIEEAFANQYVSNPNSGEIVKGHRIVLAELGLVAFEGKLVRDPGTFDGMWNKQQREDHILHRLAFVREIFTHLGYASVILYRGSSFDGQPKPRRNPGFISTTFSLEVAMSLFSGRDQLNTGILKRQPVPIERVFMSYLETAQMNQQFKEAEAIVMFDPENAIF
jgi:hypothetical protein